MIHTDMIRKTKSQSALLQRRWTSSIRPSSSHLKSNELSRSKTYHPSRGVIPAPHDSQVLDSRPVSRQGLNPQAKRPSSAVRPLSGHVFMRHSSKHGWVAKGYPDMHSSSSQPNLDSDLFGTENLDCESLDSFFDDDFEDQGTVEKLGNLLSCNTLGVETKAVKQDWVSGEVDIPRFHCPRCRDHWYGISSFPCDEELARLIKEGLWHTGKDPNETNKSITSREATSKISKPNERDRNHDPFTFERDEFSIIKQTKYHSGNNSGDAKWGLKREEGAEKTKKKKRITFQLDDDSTTGGSNDHSGEHDGRDKSKKNAGKDLHKVWDISGGDGADEASSDSAGSKGRGMIGGNLEGGVGGGLATEMKTEEEEKKKRTRKKREQDSTTSEATADGTTAEGSVRKMKTKQSSRTGNSGQNSSNFDIIASDRVLTNQERIGSLSRNGGKGIQGFRDLQLDESKTMGGEGAGGHDNSNTRMSGQLHGATEGKHQNDGNSSSTGDQQEHTQAKHRELQDSSIQQKRNELESVNNKRGEEKGNNSFTQPKDHGKRIRKSGGYMRAVSPTSSEWGDPLHARSFLSSTAASRTGSTSNLLADSEDNYDRDLETKSQSFLPPIVSPIHRPLPTYMDYEGPQITRPWTFSYH